VTLAAGTPRPPHQVADLINKWAAYELGQPRTPPTNPGVVAGRCAILARVVDECGEAGLFTADPTRVALHHFGGQVRSRRREKSARRIASAIEDFRAWHIIQTHRGS